MNRQAIFDHFVKTLNGKGRAADHCGCLYFPDFYAPDGSGRHPGCAIGCQPGFREKFEGKIYNNERVKCIRGVKTFFKIRNPSDMEFLQNLQNFHDGHWNWEGIFIKPSELSKFAESEGLEVPKISS